jgi:hypothetical protein
MKKIIIIIRLGLEHSFVAGKGDFQQERQCWKDRGRAEGFSRSSKKSSIKKRISTSNLTIEKM